MVPDDARSDGSRHPVSTARGPLVVALVAWAGLVAAITLRPASTLDGQVDLARRVTDWLQAHGVPLTYGLVEALANVAMFVPLGALLVLLTTHPSGLARTVLRASVVGLAISTGIEVAQALWLPSRVPTVRDVVMNILGAATGALCALVVLARRARLPL